MVDERLEIEAEQAYGARHIDRNTFCAACHYNLRMLPRCGRCPECGTSYDVGKLKNIFCEKDASFPLAEVILAAASWLLGVPIVLGVYSGLTWGIYFWSLLGLFLAGGLIITALRFTWLSIRGLSRFVHYRKIVRQLPKAAPTPPKAPAVLGQASDIPEARWLDRSIRRNIYCAHCGCNLRTRPYYGRCPECGQDYAARPLRRNNVIFGDEMVFLPVGDLILAVFFVAAGVTLLVNPVDKIWTVIGLGCLAPGGWFSYVASGKIRRFLHECSIHRRADRTPEEPEK